MKEVKKMKTMSFLQPDPPDQKLTAFQPDPPDSTI
ncbi:hypothetical protein J2Z48_002119 [Croceifilum oryzae]|uniref:Uncharacterized protein n=1 Tax=Croceifilum oryzae TaxID=1553429 RepID=A0AAJ1TFE3_9BACL|nr:hypothetical protein [Croceifilum oryzae]